MRSIQAIASLESRYRSRAGIAPLAISRSVSEIAKEAIFPSPPPQTLQAPLWLEGMDRFFDGDIWLFPTKRAHDFETVVSPKSFSFSLYNSKEAPVDLLSIIASNEEGMRLSNLVAPLSIPARGTKEFTLTAEPQGDLEIKTTFLFVFTHQSLLLRLHGLRAVVISLIPCGEYTEGEEWATDIFTAQNGKERRVQLCQKPKRFCEFTLTPDSSHAQESIEELISYALKFYCMMPLWFSSSTLKENTSSFTLSLDTKDKDFEVGGFVIVHQAIGFTFAKVQSLSPTTMTLDRSVTAPKGAKVVPLMKSTPDTSVNYSFFSRTGSWKIKMKELF